MCTKIILREKRKEEEEERDRGRQLERAEDCD